MILLLTIDDFCFLEIVGNIFKNCDTTKYDNFQDPMYLGSKFAKLINSPVSVTYIFEVVFNFGVV